MVSRPRRVTTPSVRATRVMADCVTIRTRRRSRRSATRPPTIEKMTMGTTRTRPTRPSARGERVRIQTCQSIATFCICVPTSDTSIENARRRKSRCFRAW